MPRWLTLLKHFPRASRYPFLACSLIPAVLGTALAFSELNLFSMAKFILTLSGMAAAHLAVNFFNDYFDFLYGVDPHHPPRPFSGGSQVIQEGLESPGEVLGQALFFGVGAGILALVLARLSGPAVLLIAAVGGLLGFFYSARPLLISWRGLGETVAGLSFGPLTVTGAYYVQGGLFSWSSLVLSLAPGAAIAAILFVNQYPDYHDDRRAGKRTLVVRLGLRRSRPVLPLLLVVGFLPLALNQHFNLAGSPAYFALLGLIPAGLAAVLLPGDELPETNRNRPGLLMLISYMIIHFFLILGVCVN